MHTLRRIASVALATALVLGTGMVGSAADDEEEHAIHQVTGTLSVQQQAPGGDWAAVDGIYHYRDYPISASGLTFSDARLNGDVQSTWNWDVHGSGIEPVPVWGTIRMGNDEGAWDGAFTGIRRVDGGPIDMRASLVGEGLDAGFCSTFDILATGMNASDVWIVDGVVYPC